MIHRHLRPHVGYEPVAVEDILERGKPDDWARLRDVILDDPHGPVAQTVVNVCQNCYMYGTSILWTNFVRSVQAEDKQEKNLPR
jgi:hypothetical protein